MKALYTENFLENFHNNFKTEFCFNHKTCKRKHNTLEKNLKFVLWRTCKHWITDISLICVFFICWPIWNITLWHKWKIILCKNECKYNNYQIKELSVTTNYNTCLALISNGSYICLLLEHFLNLKLEMYCFISSLFYIFRFD